MIKELFCIYIFNSLNMVYDYIGNINCVMNEINSCSNQADFIEKMMRSDNDWCRNLAFNDLRDIWRSK